MNWLTQISPVNSTVCRPCENGTDFLDRWFLGEPLPAGAIPCGLAPFEGGTSLDLWDMDHESPSGRVWDTIVVVVSMLGMIAWAVGSTTP